MRSRKRRNDWEHFRFSIYLSAIDIGQTRIDFYSSRRRYSRVDFAKSAYSNICQEYRSWTGQGSGVLIIKGF